MRYLIFFVRGYSTHWIFPLSVLLRTFAGESSFGNARNIAANRKDLRYLSPAEAAAEIRRKFHDRKADLSNSRYSVFEDQCFQYISILDRGILAEDLAKKVPIRTKQRCKTLRVFKCTMLMVAFFLHILTDFYACVPKNFFAPHECRVQFSRPRNANGQRSVVEGSGGRPLCRLTLSVPPGPIFCGGTRPHLWRFNAAVLLRAALCC